MSGMEINKARFYNSIYGVTLSEHERYNIGTYKEKKMHIILKRYFEEDEQYHEVPTNGYIADIRRDGNIIEIETSGFSGLNLRPFRLEPETGSVSSRISGYLSVSSCGKAIYIMDRPGNTGNIGKATFSKKGKCL